VLQLQHHYFLRLLTVRVWATMTPDQYLEKKKRDGVIYSHLLTVWGVIYSNFMTVYKLVVARRGVDLEMLILPVL
jgi:hypothetical protein